MKNSKDYLPNSDPEKAQHFLDNLSNYNISWKEISQKLNISKATLIGLRSHPERFETGRWKTINKLARLEDEQYIKRALGNKPMLIKKMVKDVIDTHVPGNSKVAEAIKQNAKSDPVLIAKIANIIEKEEEMKKNEKESKTGKQS